MIKTYSSYDLLGKEMGYKNRTTKTIWERLEDWFSSSSKTVSLRIQIPTTIYIRTKLLCEFIENEVESSFRIQDFLLVLYENFIEKSIKKYNPLFVYQEINKIYSQDHVLTIKHNETMIQRKRRESGQTIIYCTMAKKEALKGEMLLAEIDEIYGYHAQLEDMLATLWLNFIEEYKRGDNNKALEAIIKMLKRMQKQD